MDRRHAHDLQGHRLDVTGGDGAVCLPSGEKYAQAVQCDPVGAAESVDHQRHEHLRVEFEDPAHEGMLGRAPRDVDDLPDQTPAAVASRPARSEASAITAPNSTTRRALMSRSRSS